MCKSCGLYNWLMVFFVLAGFAFNYLMIIEIRTPPAGATYEEYMEEIEWLLYENEGLKLEIHELRKAIDSETPASRRH